LTGRAPFRAASSLETLMQVIYDEPAAPSQLQPRTPRDLETICLKCLEKDPLRRYARAADLADDLHRFLAGEPVRARPVGALERGWKWAKRRPALAGMMALCALVVTVSFALISLKWLEATRARDLARTESERAAAELERAERALYFNRIALAEREWLGHQLAPSP